MKDYSLTKIEELVERYPELRVNKSEIVKVAECIIAAYRSGNKILCCGNGGRFSAYCRRADEGFCLQAKSKC